MFGTLVYNLLAVVLAVVAVASGYADSSALLVVGAVSYSPTTAKTDLVKLYKKIQTKLFTGFKFKVEEYDDIDLGKFDVNWSAREILFPLDLNEGGNVASIPEGGWEALPTSPTLEEGTTTWIQLNKRFTVTKIAQYIDEAQGVRPQIKRQFKHQGTKALQAIAWQYGLYHYGQSTGVIALVAGAPNANVITLDTAYNVSGLASSGSSYDKRYLASLFKVGERIASLNPAGPALREIMTITDVDPANGTITVDDDGTTADNDLLVYANSIEDTTLAGGTDYNKAPVGMMEVLTASALHGLTHDNWSVAYSDTASGRFNGQKLQRMKDEIANWAPDGAVLDRLVMDQAVYRDTVAQYQAFVRFDDPHALEIEGDFKSKRVKIKKTRRVPPGLVAGYWSGAWKRMTLFDTVESPESFMDGDKLENQNAMVFMMDYPYQYVCTARKAFTYLTNQQGI
jgi:hypothetical protein